VYERGEPIHDAEFPEPPELDCEEPRYLPDGDVELAWRAVGKRPAARQGRSSKTKNADEPGRAAEELLYLVQWEDETGTWRGVDARSRVSTITVPNRLRVGRQALRLRILATNGLSTGSCEIEIRGRRIDPPVTVLTSELAGGIVRAWAVDHLGRARSNAGLAWYDDAGGELSQGAELDLRAGPGGPRLVRLVAWNVGAGKAELEIVLGR
jgi:hypothetical protein